MASPATEKAPALRRRGAERKREILVAAREVFSAKGYENTSIAEIAAKVGVVEGAIYKHFATKRDLLFEAMCTFYRPLIEHTREELAGIRGTRNRLRFIIWRQLRGFAEEPGICRLIIQDIRPRQDYADSVVHELNRESTSLMLRTIEDAVSSGEFRSDIPATLVRDLIYGGIEHIAWRVLAGRGSLDIDQLADHLTEIVVSGIGASPPADDSAAKPLRPGEDFAGERRKLEAQVDRLERMLDAMDRDAAASGEAN